MPTDTQLLREVDRAPSFNPGDLSAAAPTTTPSGQVNILLVDDRPDKLLALEAILSDLGQNLIKATSGREALRQLLQRDFAVVLLDVSMPGMDGFETAALMRQRLYSEHTPVIFVTSHNDADNHIARGYSLGAVDYISSPVVPQVLKTKVSVFVELYKKTEQIKQQAKRLLQVEEAEHRKRLISVLEAYPDIVFVVGADRSIEFKNPAAEEFARAVGMTERFPPPLQAQVEHVLETGESLLPTTFEGVHRFRVANAERYFLPRMVPMGSDARALFGVAVMLQDVTEFRLLDEIKSNLIATVSHELKTPITSIRTVLLMLLEQPPDKLNSKQAELVGIARDETERLLYTLDTLLDLTRFEEGFPGMRFEIAMPETLIAAAIEETRLAATAAGVKISLTLGQDLPALKADRERLVHSLTNLLSNAIKHSPKDGEVLVHVQRHGEESVRFTVADRGPGIPEEYHDKIFEKFFRLPGNAKNGAGLGLSIAREFVKAHGGTIGLHSAPGKGSEFHITLKKAPPAERG
jgi:signal transduction histidine kinase